MSESDANGHRPGLSTRLAERLAARRFDLQPATTRYRVTRGVKVPMRDGVHLLADHYAPVTHEPAGTLLLRGPYRRDSLPARVTVGLYAARGYHVVFQSTRGTFGSGGSSEPCVGEVEDGADTVEWLRRQPWFTGTFATVGGSYLGFTQLALLSDPPPELAAAVVTMGPHDLGVSAWSTGSFALLNFVTWAYQLGWHEHGGWLRQLIRSALTPRRVRPVLEELPVGVHAAGILGESSRLFESWSATPDPSAEFWRHRSVAFEQARQPVLLIGGWQDLFFDQTLEQYRRLRNRGADVALVIGPWTHGEGGGTAIRESLDWVGGRRRTQPVRICVTGGGGWRDLPDWPPPPAPLILHPHSGSVLSHAPAADFDGVQFVYDPADPTPTLGGRLLMDSAAGYRDDGPLAERADVATFTGDALETDVEIIGVPHVELAHRTDTPSADVAVRISDVDPNGRSHNVSDGYLRVGSDYPSPLRVDLDAIAHRFRAGHRIRLMVAGGSFPRYARNLGGGEPLSTATEFLHTTHVIDCSRSRLVLPRVDDRADGKLK